MCFPNVLNTSCAAPRRKPIHDLLELVDTLSYKALPIHDPKSVGQLDIRVGTVSDPLKAFEYFRSGGRLCDLAEGLEVHLSMNQTDSNMI